MELVGKVLAYRDDDGCLRVVFRCTNKEEFVLVQPPSIKRIPPDLLVRAVTRRTLRVVRELDEHVLVHWEEVS